GGDLIARYEDGRAVALHFVLHAGLLQRLGDRRGLLQVEVGVEEGLGLAQIEGEGDQRGGPPGGDAEDGGQAADSEPLKRADELIQRERSPTSGEARTHGSSAARQDLPSRW